MTRKWLPMKYGLLSYSSMSKFLECPRKFAFQYIDKAEVEGEDGIGLIRGRVFHSIIDTNNFDALQEIPDDVNRALVSAVAKLYLKKKERGDFPVVTHTEQKIINEKEQFIGYADEMSVDEKTGNWMVGELKTGSIFNPVKYAIAETKHQTALYKGMAEQFCSERFLSTNDFAGLNYKEVIFPNIKPLKGRGKNAVPESIDAFEARVYDKAQIYHKIVKVSDSTVSDALYTFRNVLDAIDHLGSNPDKYMKNCNSCLHPHFGACQYLELCHGIKINLTDEVSSDIDMGEIP